MISGIFTSDAAGEATPYAVAATQLGHVSIGYATALLGVLCGAPAAWAIGATVALWLGVWEGLQYLRDRGAGHRVRRRWDWAADGACYALGGRGGGLVHG